MDYLEQAGTFVRTQPLVAIALALIDIATTLHNVTEGTTLTTTIQTYDGRPLRVENIS